ncbi:NlpC/P60 family protein [Streptomyces sp. NPDC008313]|uniref:C40 family peptidase n=1 Tax=Streptomyces sp. NPDC008313 TaxID=3364826 RepID=UPI0036E49BE7
MSGRLLRQVCTAAMATVTAGVLLAPATATAAPGPTPTTTAASPAPDAGDGAGDGAGERSVSALLADLRRLYQEAERATETYNATEERLRAQREKVGRLDRELATVRLALHDSRGAAGRLARQQYQGSTQISPYVRLLLARDPQQALDQGHVIRQVAQGRAETVQRLTSDERRRDALARAARKALDERVALAGRQKKAKEEVERKLREVEELLGSLSPARLAELAAFERSGTAVAQRAFVASGALGERRNPSRQGELALRYAVAQIGKPYVWGAAGPRAYDCSGLTSQAWRSAGLSIPRTSQGQWARLPRIPLDELRPGDLVIYFPEATHVALYLGDGMVIQAPRPGAKVKVSPIAANPVLGAVRPDPDGEPLAQYTPPALPPGAANGLDEGYSATTPPASDAPAAPVTEAK